MPTPRALALMFAEVKATLDHQVRTIEGLDDKAAQVFRLAALIVGLAATGASLLISGPLAGRTTPWWLLGLSAGGFVALLLSALVALWAYQVTRVGLGLRAEHLVEAISDKDLEERTFHREAVITYPEAIVGNAVTIEATSSRLRAATWALWAGILFVAGATMGLYFVGGN